MKFEEVLPALREGKKIRRKGIVLPDYYSFIFIKDGKIVLNSDANNKYALDEEDLNANDWEIVKEKKKVKLRDLTEEQFEKWKDENCMKYRCFKNCPFGISECVNTFWIGCKDMFSDKFLDQEVEIEE